MKIKKTIGFFSGTSMGYLGGSFLSGSQVNQAGLISSLIFNFGTWQIHFHHWLISICFLIFLFYFLKKRYSLLSLFFTFIVGVLSGLAFQGIHCYDDWHQILIKK